MPARWMAFKDNELRERDLFERGFGHLVTGKKDGWLYCSWNKAKSFEALVYLGQVVNM